MLGICSGPRGLSELLGPWGPPACVYVACACGLAVTTR